MKENTQSDPMKDDIDVKDQKSALVAELASLLLAENATMTTAESCTGGLIAGALTDMPGSSAWFEQSVVTYSNRAKQALLGVPAAVFEQDGAVSEACVLAMASGIAGPDGAVPGKPVGTVWLGWAVGERLSAELLHLQGDRLAVREQAVLHALRGTIARIRKRE